MKNKKEKSSFIKFIVDSRYVMISFVVGLLLGLGIMQAFIPTQIATLSDDSTSIALWGEKDKDGKYSEGLSANELYDSLKEKIDIQTVLDLIDTKILEKDYPYEEYKAKAEDSAEEYISFYVNSYGMSESDFLGYYGFASRDAFVEYLTLDTQRYDYFSNTVKSSIKESQIKKFYKNDVFGDIKIKYLSVQIDDDSEVDETLIKEIAKKVKNGVSYDDISTEYKGKDGFTASSTTISFDGAQETKLVNAVRKLKNGKHTSSYIKTESLGYVIIYRESSETKPDYDEVKDLIPDIILNNMTSEDEKLYTRTFIELRKKAGVEFTDTNFAKLYSKYVKENK